VLDELHCEEFIDRSPAEVHATLLDRGVHHCSVRTMYRILEQVGENSERRAQRTHPEYHKPELLAVRPNEVWSWDITRLRGPRKWTYYYLYVVTDIFSRYVPGWMVADRETASLAKRLLAETYEKQGIAPGQLTLHNDRGAPMTAKTTAQLLAELGVEPSFSRPHVSDDNPFSEAQFKTLKYQPAFPDRFGSIDHAVAFCRRFFRYYNTEHRHSGIAYLTPEDVHAGRGEEVLARRQAALDAAYAANPERFVRGHPLAPQLPREVWINPPDLSASRGSGPITPLPGNHQPVTVRKAAAAH
jgi:putative transposase